MGNTWSKKGDPPNTRPERAVRPTTNLGGPARGRPPPSWPKGAYQRPSRSTRWKSPVPPRIPPLWEIPIWCIVPAVGDGRLEQLVRGVSEAKGEGPPALVVAMAQARLAALDARGARALQADSRV